MNPSSIPPSPSDYPAAWNEKEGRKVLTGKTYLLGLLVIFACSYSQYLIPGIGLVAGAFWVYGISIMAISVIYGKPILHNAFRHTRTAFQLGLGFFGIFTVLGAGVSLLVVSVLLDLDPAALNLLQKPVPVLHVKPELAWIMVWASLVVVGPCEEFIFRGFVFGGLLRLFGTRHWLILALFSSVLFAAVHLYYALTYGIASLIPFVDIVAIGMALAITYYRSGGNLLIPALIHGVYDATGFMAVAVSSPIGSQLRGMLMLVGVIAAVMMILTRRKRVPDV
jgi:membrane protease YdiL (CAAX protease family)